MLGRVVTGKGRASDFVPAIEDVIAGIAGFKPYPGTLNLRDVSLSEELPVNHIDDPSAAKGNCDGVRIRRCAIGGVRAAVLTPLVDDYPAEKTEVVAPVHLRSFFDLRDGNPIELTRPSELWRPVSPPVVPPELEQFDAVVFDLDGTLVDLAVDWQLVRSDLRDLFVEDPFASDVDVPLGMYARERGRYDEFLSLLESHEIAGARDATARPLLSLLDELDCPVGICTKNAERAATIALGQFDTLKSVDAIVARETTIEQKPDPAPLSACLDRLGADAGRAVFVGDERDDCDAARRAGTNFVHPEQLSH
ncbi:HAD-IA family hydrolase [Natrinema gelatinilyticum]|uniref:HAD-IA family hydrolase n=1 Tax=Natrinema gelatinilyticum TaxID=2961571 RepID=UPI0020C52D5B|nr:HAD-IA family hydrolase [Natrinema gelatinilyticum]